MRKLQSYIDKYGKEEGTKMYRRLQRQAALSSGHARQKKKLATAAAELGSKGGKKRAANLTKEQRSEIARKGALARWGKKGGRP